MSVVNNAANMESSESEREDSVKEQTFVNNDTTTAQEFVDTSKQDLEKLNVDDPLSWNAWLSGDIDSDEEEAQQMRARESDNDPEIADVQGNLHDIF